MPPYFQILNLYIKLKSYLFLRRSETHFDSRTPYYNLNNFLIALTKLDYVYNVIFLVTIKSRSIENNNEEQCTWKL